MDRQQHLQWSKDRALEYVDSGDLNNAFASFISDMGKHDDTRGHLALEMGTSLLLGNQLTTPHQMKDWINGTN